MNKRRSTPTTKLTNSAKKVKSTVSSGYTMLMLRVEEGNIEEIRNMFERNSVLNVNTQSKTGQTALALSARNGNLSIAEYLVSQGADLNTQNKSGQTPLFISCWFGFYNIVELFLREDANVNIADYRGWTPLMIACYHGYRDIVQLLLQSNADILAIDCFGKRAIDRCKDPVIFQILEELEEKLDPIIPDSQIDDKSFSPTPYLYSRRRGRKGLHTDLSSDREHSKDHTHSHDEKCETHASLPDHFTPKRSVYQLIHDPEIDRMHRRAGYYSSLEKRSRSAHSSASRARSRGRSGDRILDGDSFNYDEVERVFGPQGKNRLRATPNKSDDIRIYSKTHTQQSEESKARRKNGHLEGSAHSKTAGGRASSSKNKTPDSFRDFKVTKEDVEFLMKRSHRGEVKPKQPSKNQSLEMRNQQDLRDLRVHMADAKRQSMDVRKQSQSKSKSRSRDNSKDSIKASVKKELRKDIIEEDSGDFDTRRGLSGYVKDYSSRMERVVNKKVSYALNFEWKRNAYKIRKIFFEFMSKRAKETMESVLKKVETNYWNLLQKGGDEGELQGLKETMQGLTKDLMNIWDMGNSEATFQQEERDLDRILLGTAEIDRALLDDLDDNCEKEILHLGDSIDQDTMRYLKNELQVNVDTVFRALNSTISRELSKTETLVSRLLRENIKEVFGTVERNLSKFSNDHMGQNISEMDLQMSREAAAEQARRDNLLKVETKDTIGKKKFDQIGSSGLGLGNVSTQIYPDKDSALSGALLDDSISKESKTPGQTLQDRLLRDLPEGKSAGIKRPRNVVLTVQRLETVGFQPGIKEKDQYLTQEERDAAERRAFATQSGDYDVSEKQVIGKEAGKIRDQGQNKKDHTTGKEMTQEERDEEERREFARQSGDYDVSSEIRSKEAANRQRVGREGENKKDQTQYLTQEERDAETRRAFARQAGDYDDKDLKETGFTKQAESRETHKKVFGIRPDLAKEYEGLDVPEEKPQQGIRQQEKPEQEVYREFGESPKRRAQAVYPGEEQEAGVDVREERGKIKDNRVEKSGQKGAETRHGEDKEVSEEEYARQVIDNQTQTSPQKSPQKSPSKEAKEGQGTGPAVISTRQQGQKVLDFEERREPLVEGQVKSQTKTISPAKGPKVGTQPAEEENKAQGEARVTEVGSTLEEIPSHRTQLRTQQSPEASTKEQRRAGPRELNISSDSTSIAGTQITPSQGAGTSYVIKESPRFEGSQPSQNFQEPGRRHETRDTEEGDKAKVDSKFNKIDSLWQRFSEILAKPKESFVRERRSFDSESFGQSQSALSGREGRPLENEGDQQGRKTQSVYREREGQGREKSVEERLANRAASLGKRPVDIAREVVGSGEKGKHVSYQLGEQYEGQGEGRFSRKNTGEAALKTDDLNKEAQRPKRVSDRYIEEQKRSDKAQERKKTEEDEGAAPEKVPFRMKRPEDIVKNQMAKRGGKEFYGNLDEYDQGGSTSRKEERSERESLNDLSQAGTRDGSPKQRAKDYAKGPTRTATGDEDSLKRSYVESETRDYGETRNVSEAHRDRDTTQDDFNTEDGSRILEDIMQKGQYSGDDRTRDRRSASFKARQQEYQDREERKEARNVPGRGGDRGEALSEISTEKISKGSDKNRSMDTKSKKSSEDQYIFSEEHRDKPELKVQDKIKESSGENSQRDSQIRDISFQMSMFGEGASSDRKGRQESGRAAPQNSVVEDREGIEEVIEEQRKLVPQPSPQRDTEGKNAGGARKSQEAHKEEQRVESEGDAEEEEETVRLSVEAQRAPRREEGERITEVSERAERGSHISDIRPLRDQRGTAGEKQPGRQSYNEQDVVVGGPEERVREEQRGVETGAEQRKSQTRRTVEQEEVKDTTGRTSVTRSPTKGEYVSEEQEAERQPSPIKPKVAEQSPVKEAEVQEKQRTPAKRDTASEQGGEKKYITPQRREEEGEEVEGGVQIQQGIRKQSYKTPGSQSKKVSFEEQEVDFEEEERHVPASQQSPIQTKSGQKTDTPQRARQERSGSKSGEKGTEAQENVSAEEISVERRESPQQAKRKPHLAELSQGFQDQEEHKGEVGPQESDRSYDAEATQKGKALEAAVIATTPKHVAYQFDDEEEEEEQVQPQIKTPEKKQVQEKASSGKKPATPAQAQESKTVEVDDQEEEYGYGAETRHGVDDVLGRAGESLSKEQIAVDKRESPEVRRKAHVPQISHDVEEEEAYTEQQRREAEGDDKTPSEEEAPRQFVQSQEEKRPRNVEEEVQQVRGQSPVKTGDSARKEQLTKEVKPSPSGIRGKAQAAEESHEQYEESEEPVPLKQQSPGKVSPSKQEAQRVQTQEEQNDEEVEEEEYEQPREKSPAKTEESVQREQLSKGVKQSPTKGSPTQVKGQVQAVEGSEEQYEEPEQYIPVSTAEQPREKSPAKTEESIQREQLSKGVKQSPNKIKVQPVEGSEEQYEEPEQYIPARQQGGRVPEEQNIEDVSEEEYEQPREKSPAKTEESVQREQLSKGVKQSPTKESPTQVKGQVQAVEGSEEQYVPARQQGGQVPEEQNVEDAGEEEYDYGSNVEQSRQKSPTKTEEIIQGERLSKSVKKSPTKGEAGHAESSEEQYIEDEEEVSSVQQPQGRVSEKTQEVSQRQSVASSKGVVRSPEKLSGKEELKIESEVSSPEKVEKGRHASPKTGDYSLTRGKRESYRGQPGESLISPNKEEQEDSGVEEERQSHKEHTSPTKPQELIQETEDKKAVSRQQSPVKQKTGESPSKEISQSSEEEYEEAERVSPAKYQAQEEEEQTQIGGEKVEGKKGEESARIQQSPSTHKTQSPTRSPVKQQELLEEEQRISESQQEQQEPREEAPQRKSPVKTEEGARQKQEFARPQVQTTHKEVVYDLAGEEDEYGYDRRSPDKPYTQESVQPAEVTEEVRENAPTAKKSPTKIQEQPQIENQQKSPEKLAPGQESQAHVVEGGQEEEEVQYTPRQQGWVRRPKVEHQEEGSNAEGAQAREQTGVRGGEPRDSAEEYKQEDLRRLVRESGAATPERKTSEEEETYEYGYQQESAEGKGVRNQAQSGSKRMETSPEKEVSIEEEMPTEAEAQKPTSRKEFEIPLAATKTQNVGKQSPEGRLRQQENVEEFSFRPVRAPEKAEEFETPDIPSLNELIGGTKKKEAKAKPAEVAEENKEIEYSYGYDYDQSGDKSQQMVTPQKSVIVRESVQESGQTKTVSGDKSLEKLIEMADSKTEELSKIMEGVDKIISDNQTEPSAVRHARSGSGHSFTMNVSSFIPSPMPSRYMKFVKERQIENLAYGEGFEEPGQRSRSLSSTGIARAQMRFDSPEPPAAIGTKHDRSHSLTRPYSHFMEKK